jgi:excisionase family DNA binding protein
MSQTTADLPSSAVQEPFPEVLTLEEAASFLRVSEGDIEELARQQGLPGRKIGDQWRFLKMALQDWLRMPETGDLWTRHFAALKDDPYREEMLDQIYRQRGRPML